MKKTITIALCLFNLSLIAYAQNHKLLKNTYVTNKIEVYGLYVLPNDTDTMAIGGNVPPESHNSKYYTCYEINAYNKGYRSHGLKVTINSYRFSGRLPRDKDYICIDDKDNEMEISTRTRKKWWPWSLY